uniref:Uncharacterized protein n=1 Tax=Hyaloperonospora arabidopsidis (strain Emoy2) TaxID=559515 RepID=M4BQ35_HYAAE
MMRMRHWHHIQHSVRMMQSSRTRSMSSKSWPFNEKKALGAMVTTLKNQRDYVFTPLSVEERLRQTTGQTLATWTVGPVAASPEEGESGQTLRDRYLEPYLTTQRQYKVRLKMQARGAPVPPIKGVPILLFAGKTTTSFAGCTALVVSSMYALRASVSVVDVRLERKLRHDYAKLTARGQLRNRTRYASATTVTTTAGQTVTTNPPTHTTSGGKRPWSRDDPDHDVQKRQSCRRVISYSHEFSDSGYPRHFTRYWYWP